MYDIQWLKTKFDSDERLKFLFFWGHTPAMDGSVNSSCLSQWWKCRFEHNGLTFRSTEHWMMYQKALLFNDLAIAQQILDCHAPGEAKELGRKVTNFDNDIWNANRIQIVVEGNLLKFNQNDALRTFLLNTKQRILVEASPVDEIWGVGLSKDAKTIHNPHQWRGLNLLGFALMEVRDLISGKV